MKHYVVAVLIILLAGCTAGGIATPTDTVTPSPTPTPTLTATPTPAPPPEQLNDSSALFYNCQHRADLIGPNVIVPYYICEDIVHDGERVGGLAYGPPLGDSFHMIVVSKSWVDVGGETMAILHELGHSVFGYPHYYSSVMVHDPTFAPCKLHDRTKRIANAFDTHFTVIADGSCEAVYSNKFGKYPNDVLR